MNAGEPRKCSRLDSTPPSLKHTVLLQSATPLHAVLRHPALCLKFNRGNPGAALAGELQVSLTVLLAGAAAELLLGKRQLCRMTGRPHAPWVVP